MGWQTNGHLEGAAGMEATEETPLPGSPRNKNAGGLLRVTHPQLFTVVDHYAIKTQRFYFACLLTQLALLFLTVVVSGLGNATAIHAILQTLLLLLLFGITAYLYFARTAERWYAARTLAESLLTRSWRYLMKASPFNEDDKAAEARLSEDIAQLARAFPLLPAQLFEKHSSIDEATAEAMQRIRALTASERSALYRRERIYDQHLWYQKKARIKGSQNRLFSLLFLLFVLCSLVIAATRIVMPEGPIWPIDALISLAMAMLTWNQSKKFAELAASYRQAAGETQRMLIHWPEQVTFDEEQLARLVADTESVFSQEHTQWSGGK